MQDVGFQLLGRNVKQIRSGLVFKAIRLWYHSTLDSRVIKKKKMYGFGFKATWGGAVEGSDVVGLPGVTCGTVSTSGGTPEDAEGLGTSLCSGRAMST